MSRLLKSFSFLFLLKKKLIKLNDNSSSFRITVRDFFFLFNQSNFLSYLYFTIKVAKLFNNSLVMNGMINRYVHIF